MSRVIIYNIPSGSSFYDMELIQGVVPMSSKGKLVGKVELYYTMYSYSIKGHIYDLAITDECKDTYTKPAKNNPWYQSQLKKGKKW